MSELTEAQVIAKKLRGGGPQWPISSQCLVEDLDPDDWLFVRDCWRAQPSSRPTMHSLYRQAHFTYVLISGKTLTGVDGLQSPTGVKECSLNWESPPAIIYEKDNHPEAEPEILKGVVWEDFDGPLTMAWPTFDHDIYLRPRLYSPAELGLGSLLDEFSDGCGFFIRLSSYSDCGIYAKLFTL